MPVSEGVPEGVLLGMGNPLLDISADVPQEVLDKCVLAFARLKNFRGSWVGLHVGSVHGR